MVSLSVGCSTNFADKGRHLLNSRRPRIPLPAIQWKPYVQYDFSKNGVMKNFKIVNGEWIIRNGKLIANSGKKNRTILLAKVKNSPLRITFKATNIANTNGSLGDITVLINSVNITKDKAFFYNGYAFTTGSFYNNCTTLYKKGDPIARTEYSPLVSGKTYNVMIELINGHIRYWLDDKIILEAWDSHPLKLDPNLWIGLRTWNTKMSIEDFVVYQGSTAKEQQ
jgi:hypothetical protein